MMRRLVKQLVILLTLNMLASWAMAEQKQVFGNYEVHYIVVPTTFLKPDMAAKYNITRSQNRALLNISVLKEGTPVPAQVSAQSKNLLSQVTQLDFEEVREGIAIYYLALIRHSDEAVHQISIDVKFDDATSGNFEFQQRLYHEE